MKFARHKLTLGLAAIVASGPLHAETLADAIALSYRGNPTLQGSRYDLRATDEGIVQARSELRPNASVQITGGYDRTVLGNAALDSDPFATRVTAGPSSQSQFVATQPIYTGGRATADRNAAEANVQSGRQVLRGTEGDLLLAVITAYVDVRRLTAVREIWKTSVGELERIGKEIAARQIAGEVTRTDVAQADTQLQIAREQAVATELDLESARADYATLVGQEPGVLAQEPPLPNIPRSIGDAFDLAEQQNPEIGRARSTELASRAEISVARSAGAPTISLRGAATLSGNAAPYRYRDEDHSVTGSMVLSIPLTNGGLIASQVRQAQDRNASDRFKIDETRRELFRDVSNAWNQVLTAQRQLTLLDRQDQSARTQLDGMLSEYRVGLRSTFDVLYAQQSLHNVEVAALGSRRDYYVAEATLLRKMGQLEAPALIAGIPADDPSAALDKIQHRNAVPWEGAVAALDRIVTPQPKPKPLIGPADPSTPLTFRPPGPDPAAADLNHSLPNAPLLTAPSPQSQARMKS